MLYALIVVRIFSEDYVHFIKFELHLSRGAIRECYSSVHESWIELKATQVMQFRDHRLNKDRKVVTQ